jgi:hypothetical protein
VKNGETAAVVDFAEETLVEVSGVVIPAIINESENDQRFVFELFSRFELILNELSQSNEEVFQLNEEEQGYSGHHQTCRADEKIKCDHKRACEMELYRLWTIWVEEEEDLREIHEFISGHFCPPDANGTLHTFRVTSVPYMHQYMAQKVIVDAAELAYDGKVPDCVTKHTLLDQKSDLCNTAQTHLEEKACEHAHKINEVLTNYYNDYGPAVAQYSCAIEEIKLLEIDRKREWVTLQVVNCLLERIREQNGVPCDTANGGVTDEVGICEERHGVDVCSEGEGEPRLCLEYPNVPPPPPSCPDRHQVTGRCLPVIQPMPCQADWHSQQYANLPAVPEPPFSATNPGCNAYPECVDCTALPDLSTAIPDSCPGYTIDGCATSNSEVGEHPLSHNRSNDFADVRCCSMDGTVCQSQDFENLEFQGLVGVAGTFRNTEDVGSHTGCFLDVTYQEALLVCHHAGMRICSTEEVQTCCGTGCWHDHHAIWVNVVNQVSTQLD